MSFALNGFQRAGRLAGTTQTDDLTQTGRFGGVVGIPTTLVLTSSDASRAIQISIDGGTTFFTPVYDWSNATQLGVAIMAPITHVRFTGVAGDTWGVL